MKQVESMVKKVSPFPTFPDRKPSKVGDARRELEACEHGVHVFMTCWGYALNERRRVLLPKTSTLRQAREQFGREMRQSKVTDEYGFAFSEADLDLPLWQFSDGGALHIVFVHNDLEKAIEHISTPLRWWQTAPSPEPSKL